MKSQEKFRTYLDAEAKKLGFNGVGIANPHFDFKTQAYLEKFVAAGWHGSMGWMADTLERRAKPVNLWPDVKSIIMLSMNYGPETNPLAVLKQPHRGAISVYARHRDYHDVIKGRLKTLASKIVSKTDADVKVFVDTAPVMEKPLAKQAGLGWQGKHTNLVSREFGSWLFLGSIFTTLELSADVPESDNCGSCSDCLDVCPTDAFPAPYQIDARRCISYLTIENKGPIPVEFRKPMGNRIYGCDDCLAVCPWNKFAQSATELKLAAPNEPKSDLLKGFLQLNDVEFRNRFAGSPVKRIGRNRFIRNCLIAAGNSKQENLVPDVMSLTSDDDPVVAEAADWAATELDPT